MRTRFLNLLAFLLLASVIGSTAQTARIQVIHNAADPAADSVDVYLNGTRLLDNFKFRTATPFIDAPAGVAIKIGIAPGNSTSVADTLKSFTYTLAAGEKYVLVANGVLSPSGFSPNPGGRSTGFTLLVKTPVIERGHGGSVNISVVHGATDAPPVDVVARGVGTLVNNAAYGDITGYLTVPPAMLYAGCEGQFRHRHRCILRGESLWSGRQRGGRLRLGFSRSIEEQDRQALWPVRSPGQRNRGRTSGNHRTIAGDPQRGRSGAAAKVDIYLNGKKLLDDFAFRTATPFIDVPAQLNLNIGVAPGTSTSFADTLTSFNVSLAEGEKYVALANGVLNPAGFAANPNGRNRAFTLLVKAGARESSTSTGNVQFFVVHGATDAPFVDVDARGVGNLVNNAGLRRHHRLSDGSAGELYPRCERQFRRRHGRIIHSESLGIGKRISHGLCIRIPCTRRKQEWSRIRALCCACQRHRGPLQFADRRQRSWKRDPVNVRSHTKLSESVQSINADRVRVAGSTNGPPLGLQQSRPAGRFTGQRAVRSWRIPGGFQCGGIAFGDVLLSA